MEQADQPARQDVEDTTEDRLLERITMLNQQQRTLENQLAQRDALITVLARRTTALERYQPRVLLKQLYYRAKRILNPAKKYIQPITPITHFLFSPSPHARLFGSIEIYGWAFSHQAAIDRVEVWIDDMLLGTVAYGLPQIDAAKYLGQPEVRNCAYSGRFVVPTKYRSVDSAMLRVRVIDTHGNQHEHQQIMRTLQSMYATWAQTHTSTLAISPTLAESSPHVRFVILVNTHTSQLLSQVLDTIQRQTLTTWDAIILHPNLPGMVSNDQRVRARVLDETIQDWLAILGDECFDYVVVLDAPVLLKPDFLMQLHKATQASVSGDLWYCDHEYWDAVTKGYLPCLKPNWSPEYHRQSNYIGPVACLSKSFLVSVELPDHGLLPFTWVYALLLQAIETQARVEHIAVILYQTMDVQQYQGVDQQLQLLTSHFDRLSITGATLQADQRGRIRVSAQPVPSDSAPLVSIIIPTHNAPHLIKPCLDSIYTRTSYRPFEVILVDNATDDSVALAIMNRYPLVHVPLSNPFNYSRANNIGTRHAKGQFLVFLNNDTEIETPDWIEQLLYYTRQPDIGAAGALLLYPNHTVQHVGVVIGLNGIADHVLRGFPLEPEPLDDAFVVARERSAVTAACMMVKRSDNDLIHGFDETFTTHLQDVDYCLRLRQLGRRNIVTPHAQIIHHESATRYFEPDTADEQLMYNRWQEQLNNTDPYFHRSYDQHAVNLALRYE